VSTNQNLHNNYILVTGAPGSRWSSVAHDIRYCPEIDRSDENPERQYISPMAAFPARHLGAYWDPGMEFGNEREEWDKPFSGNGIRVIKSHTFAHKLQQLLHYNYPIILVYRNDVESLYSWSHAGGFKITYPNYTPYYKDLGTMYQHIVQQNRDIMDFIHNNQRVKRIYDTIELQESLNLTPTGKFEYYKDRDIVVYVYR
jgi:hypothetical protein